MGEEKEEEEKRRGEGEADFTFFQPLLSAPTSRAQRSQERGSVV